MRKQTSVDLLSHALKQLEAGMAWLERSYAQCSSIGVKEEYSAEEYDRYENLTSRYARVADLIVHKVLRSVDAAELLEPGTLIDTANRAVARGLVDSVETLRGYKDLRNDIAHEYQTNNLSELFSDVLQTTPELLSVSRAILDYGIALIAGSTG